MTRDLPEAQVEPRVPAQSEAQPFRSGCWFMPVEVLVESR